ncbi:MAG: hypothetical protein ACXAEU_11320 [Candidatus Hodarchaeales archaeon]
MSGDEEKNDLFVSQTLDIALFIVDSWNNMNNFNQTPEESSHELPYLSYWKNLDNVSKM